MHISDFDWDDKNENHIARHKVSIFEVEEIFLYSKPIYQKTKDNKYIAYGLTEDGRYLLIVFVLKESSKIRVITARDMIIKEKRYYKKKKGIR